MSRNIYYNYYKIRRYSFINESTMETICPISIRVRLPSLPLPSFWFSSDFFGSLKNKGAAELIEVAIFEKLLAQGKDSYGDVCPSLHLLFLFGASRFSHHPHRCLVLPPQSVFPLVPELIFLVLESHFSYGSRYHLLHISREDYLSP